ncbi:uncharacterized protein LOC135089440 [Scylla paramamosain]|uniref:uncharacterized protein LOC135089440 n=1 Tax=Scylla paramamosain TaxID=85552 RepID=UPI00308271E8
MRHKLKSQQTQSTHHEAPGCGVSACGSGQRRPVRRLRRAPCETLLPRPGAQCGWFLRDAQGAPPGVCVHPAPPPQAAPSPAPLPKPEVIQNIVFIRVPEQEDVDDIVIPPPQQKSVVFVLNKRNPDQGSRVIEVPSPPPSSPDVYFVNFKDGENPTLPGGIDLHTALQNAEHGGGHVIGDFDDLGEGLYGDQDDGFIHDGGVILNGGSSFISDDTVTIGGGRVTKPSTLYGTP